MNYEEMIYIALVIVILFNLYATYKVFKSDYYGNIQKVIQLMIVWVLSIIGFLIVLHFAEEEYGRNNDHTAEGGANNSFYSSDSSVSGGD